jgi:hypothetical protein
MDCGLIHGQFALEEGSEIPPKAPPALSCLTPDGIGSQDLTAISISLPVIDFPIWPNATKTPSRLAKLRFSDGSKKIGTAKIRVLNFHTLD